MKSSIGKLLMLILVFVGVTLSNISANASLTVQDDGTVFDDCLNIYWLANANLSLTEHFGVEGINPNGSMNWDTANEWITAMNSYGGTGYLGYNDWRLPSPLNPDGTGPCTGPTCTESEMAHLFFAELGGIANDIPGIRNKVTDSGDPDLDKFTGILSYYWSNLEFDTQTAYDFDFWGYVQGINPKSDGHFVWPVRSGNQSPVANAGDDQVVFDTVTLDGSDSYDPDGSVVSYEWNLEYVDDSNYDQTAIGVNPTIIDLYPGFYNTYLTVTDNEGATNTDTSLVAAAGSCSCTAGAMQVESIIASTVRGSKGNSYGEVIVTVADDCGNPVVDATVTGTFSGDFNETRSGVTDSNGMAVIRTISEFKKPSYTFCVDNVVKGPLVYDNIESCDSN